MLKDLPVKAFSEQVIWQENRSPRQWLKCLISCLPFSLSLSLHSPQKVASSGLRSAEILAQHIIRRRAARRGSRRGSGRNDNTSRAESLLRRGVDATQRNNATGERCVLALSCSELGGENRKRHRDKREDGKFYFPPHLPWHPFLLLSDSLTRNSRFLFTRSAPGKTKHEKNKGFVGETKRWSTTLDNVRWLPVQQRLTLLAQVQVAQRLAAAHPVREWARRGTVWMPNKHESDFSLHRLFNCCW